MIRATVSAWKSSHRNQASTYPRNHHQNSSGQLCLPSHLHTQPTSTKQQLHSNKPSSQSGKNSEQLFHLTIAWESWGHVICFLPIILSIEYWSIYALFPCTQICFPELQSFQKKKCYLLKREHSSIDFSYRFWWWWCLAIIISWCQYRCFT